MIAHQLGKLLGTDLWKNLVKVLKPQVSGKLLCFGTCGCTGKTENTEGCRAAGRM